MSLMHNKVSDFNMSRVYAILKVQHSAIKNFLCVYQIFGTNSSIQFFQLFFFFSLVPKPLTDSVITLVSLKHNFVGFILLL